MTFETILNAGVIENAVMKSTLRSKHVDRPLQSVSSLAGFAEATQPSSGPPSPALCGNVF